VRANVCSPKKNNNVISSSAHAQVITSLSGMTLRAYFQLGSNWKSQVMTLIRSTKVEQFIFQGAANKWLSA
jgi:hypothetical protein